MEEMININEWYKNLTCDDTIVLLDEKITNMRLDFIAAGFYMKRVRDEVYFRTLGYDTIWEFAEDRYGIQRSTASRWMAMNDKYSKDGNSPILLEEYREFNKSQLQEMLYLTDEQVIEVTPNMTVKEIREVRKPEQLSAYGTEKRVYPEDSLIKIKGCIGYDCFDCSQECQIRQEDRYCVEASLGHPFTCTTMNVISLLKDEMGDKCQFINNELAFHREGDGAASPCCKDCDEECGYCCNRAKKKREEYKRNHEVACATSHTEDVEDSYQEEQLPEQMHITEFPEYMPESEIVTVNDISEDVQELEVQEDVIDIDCEEVEELECIEKSDLEIAKELLATEKGYLNDFLKCFDEKDIRCRKYKIKVAALALFVCELEDQINPVFTVEQPELPVLRNNDQRKEFLESYKDWPVWFVVPEASETYYRYNFDDGSSIVICEYKYYSEWRKKYNNEDPNAVGTREYLLTPEYRYLEDCKANTTFLVEHLKKVQKKEK